MASRPGTVWPKHAARVSIDDVRDALKGAAPKSARELAAALSTTPKSIQRRLSELDGAGLIVVTPGRVPRYTIKSRAALRKSRASNVR